MDALVVPAAMTVVVADDHPLVREATVARLAISLPRARVVEAAGIEDLQHLVTSVAGIALLLLDLNMPGCHGLSALVHVKSLAPELPVIVFSGMDDPAIVRRAAGLGASGFLSKAAPPSELGVAVCMVLAGGRYLPPSVDAAVQGAGTVSSGERDAAARIATLTPQQFRIAGLLAQGRLNKQIAWELGITEATVKVHMTTILRKLGTQNRTQVALLMQTLDFEGSTGEWRPPPEIRRN